MKKIILIGFGHTGSGAFADCILSNENFSSCPFGIEFADLRKVNGLIDNYKCNDIKYYRNFFIEQLKSLKLIITYIKIKFIRKAKNDRFYIRVRDLILLLKCEISCNITKLKINKSNGKNNKLYLIKKHIEYVIDNYSNKKTKFFLLNQALLPENDFNLINQMYEKDLVYLITVRDAYTQFLDLEKTNYFFTPKDWYVEFMFGRDEYNLWRKKNFIRVTINRVKEIKKKKKENFLIYSFEKLVSDPNSFMDNLYNKFGQKNKSMNGFRYFQPEQSVKNIIDKDYVIEKLISLGYDEEAIDLLELLNLEYEKLLE